MILGHLRLHDEPAAQADELVPGPPVHIAVLAGVNRGEFPLVFNRKEARPPEQSGSQPSISPGELCAEPDSHKSERKSRSFMPRRLRPLTLASKSSAAGRS